MNDGLRVLAFDRCSGMWTEDCLVKTVEAGEEEIASLMEADPDLSREQCVIIPNDGESYKKYLPLDCGDVIFYT
ncbi:MAG: hypothetical protein WC683_15180 [bacterium]